MLTIRATLISRVRMENAYLIIASMKEQCVVTTDNVPTYTASVILIMEVSSARNAWVIISNTRTPRATNSVLMHTTVASCKNVTEVYACALINTETTTTSVQFALSII